MIIIASESLNGAWMAGGAAMLHNFKATQFFFEVFHFAD